MWMRESVRETELGRERERVGERERGRVLESDGESVWKRAWERESVG